MLDLVLQQVRRIPDRAALRHEGRELTYGDLWDRSGRLAERLRALGVGAEQVVALCAMRSPELVIGVIGILRSGGACLPLDLEYPSERLAFMLRQTNSTVVVGHRLAADHLPSGDRVDVHLDGLERLAGDWSDVPVDRRRETLPAIRPSDLCCVIYTSGSTGTPKGVMLEHRILANLVNWQMRNSRRQDQQSTLQFASISFDVSFQEIFSTLGAGGTLVCIREEERQDPLLLWNRLVVERVSRLFVPYVGLQSLALSVGEREARGLTLREVITAGEQLLANEQLRRLFAHLPGCRLANQYGPSETHVVTQHVLPSDPRTWPLLPPIGRPIDHARLHLLDESGDPIAAGEPGELGVGGTVARGYWARPDLTAERFVPEPSRIGERMYRTGDLARLLPNGDFEFLGRMDSQVKIRGVRVEPAEVEAVVGSHPRIREVAVAVHGAEAIERSLVAYVVGDLDDLGLQELRGFLAARLPAQMIPMRFHLVDRLPRTPSGKLDRRALSPRSPWR